MSNVPPNQPPPGPGWQQPGGGWQQQPPQSPPPQQPPPPGGYGPPPPGYGYQQQQQPMGPSGQPLSEWWKRLLAIIIDGLIIFVPIYVIFFGLVGTSFSRSVEVDPITGDITRGGGLLAGAGLVYMLALFIVPTVYYAVLNGSDRGQTVGKMVLKIQVRDASNGGPIGVGRGFVRSLVTQALSFFTCGIGGILDGLWPLWDQRRQALHDKVANSVVVDAA